MNFSLDILLLLCYNIFASPLKGEGISSPQAFEFAYHQRSAPITAAIVAVTLQMMSSTSAAVGFSFFRFISSPPFCIYYTTCGIICQ